MEEWKEYKLGEVCELIAGFAFKSVDFGDKGSVVVKIKDIQPPFVNLSDADRVNMSSYNRQRLEKFLISKGDFVLAMTGATIGKIGLYVDEIPAFLNQRVLKFSPNYRVDKKFLYYSLLSNSFQKYILNHIDSESAQPNISANTIGRYSLMVPPMQTQRRIAEVLSALDAKIEVNRRINDNLEQQAAALFRSWFVDFEPFGGSMPSDWKIMPLDSLIEKILSGDWGQDKAIGNYTEKVSCMRGADIPEVVKGDLGNMPTRYILEKNFIAKSLKANQLVVEISGGTATQATGRICPLSAQFINRFRGNVICSNFCKSITPKNGYKWYVYYLWNHLYQLGVMFMYENGSSGIKNFNIKEFLNRNEIPIPPIESLKEFNTTIDTIQQQIQNYGEESGNMASLRDTLLPKLMSGELKVSDVVV